MACVEISKGIVIESRYYLTTMLFNKEIVNRIRISFYFGISLVVIPRYYIIRKSFMPD